MKRLFAIILTLCLMLALCACTADEKNPTETGSGLPTAEEPVNAGTETGSGPNDTGTPVESRSASGRENDPSGEVPSFRIYSLKGPTSMGLVMLLKESIQGQSYNNYQPTMCTGADEVTAALMSGDADIALLPANAAATLYNKAGGFSVVAINTLGVLYVVENGESVQSIEDLAGKTVYLTGKGTTPEYALRYLLSAHGIEDQVTLEFKSEAQEVVSAMAENTAGIGVLPQPFVTAAMAQNEKLRIALDFNEEWAAVTQDSVLVTGVTVVRNEVLEQQKGAIDTFLKEAADGVQKVLSNPDQAAQIIEEMGIVAKAAIAQKALPFCGLTCITGPEMKSMLSGYLQTLYDQNPQAIGEAMPDEAFYYTGE